MDLSNQELQKLQAMYTYYLYKEKSRRYVLIGLGVTVGMWLILTLINRGYYLLTFSLFIGCYLLIALILWIAFTMVAKRVERKRMEMGMSRDQFERLIGYDRGSQKMTKRFITYTWEK